MTDFKSLDNWIPINPTTKDFQSPPIDFIIADIPTRAELEKKNRREYCKNNPEKISKWRIKNYKNNREKVLERSRKWYENNHERVINNGRKWCQANRERVRQRRKKWCEHNIEKIREQARNNYRLHSDKINERCRKNNIKLKQLVISHYSNSESKCACCGIIGNLTIDHINGNGTKHRNEIGIGMRFFRWLIKNNFPEGYQVLCFECNLSKNRYHLCRIHNKILSAKVG